MRLENFGEVELDHQVGSDIRRVFPATDGWLASSVSGYFKPHRRRHQPFKLLFHSANGFARVGIRPPLALGGAAKEWVTGVQPVDRFLRVRGRVSRDPCQELVVLPCCRESDLVKRSEGNVFAGYSQEFDFSPARAAAALGR